MDDEQLYRDAEAALWGHWGVAPVEHWVENAAGTRVRVLEAGDPAGPPIVFVHGASTAGSCWADLVSRLLDHRCIVLDRPGCGLSDPIVPAPSLSDFAAIADDLVADVATARGADDVHVVGNSLGGLFGLRTAAAHAARTRSVTLFGWSLGSPPNPLPLFMRLATTRGLTWLATRLPVNDRLVRSGMRRGGLGAALDEGRIPDVGIAWNVAVLNHTETRRHEYAMGRGAPLREQMRELEVEPETLADITAPVRIAFGTEDPFGTAASMQVLAASIPRGELEVWNGCGHAPWLDDLDRAEALVRAGTGT